MQPPRLNWALRNAVNDTAKQVEWQAECDVAKKELIMTDTLYSTKTSLPAISSAYSTDKQPVVFIKNGEVFANSRDIAAYFGKEVKHVHESIRNLINKEPELVSPNFRPFKINDI